VFALDEKLCRIPSLGIFPGEPDMERGRATITLLNTNTGKRIRTQLAVERNIGMVMLSTPEIAIAGVAGKGTRILLDFFEPAGAKTGKFLPTGNVLDKVVRKDRRMVEISCADATNSTVFMAVENVFSNIDDFREKTWPAFVFPILEEVRTKAAAPY
jgi:2-methylaconitate cis-trans-isomerase PrpF